MKLRSKRFLSLMLAASMVTANLGTSFAQDLGKPSITEKGKTATVTLDANGGYFGKTDIGTPSDATPGDATPPDASSSNAEKTKKVEVELTDYTNTAPHYYYAYWYNAETQMQEAGLENPIADAGYEFDGWTTIKGDISTGVAYNDILYSDTTLYANWKKEVANNSSIREIYASGLGKDQTLTVSDLETEKTTEELTTALKSNTLGFKSIIKDIKPIQLDFKPSDNYKKGTPVTITMDVPYEMHDHAIAVLHFTDDKKAEVLAPIIRNYNEMSFTLDSFSPVIILAAERDCKVVISPAAGGYTTAYTLEYDVENDTNILTYLPVGEEVYLPYNTEVRFSADATERADTWRAQYSKTEIKHGNKTETSFNRYSSRVTITEDTTISSYFVKEEYSKGEENKDPYLFISYDGDDVFEAGKKASVSLDAYFFDGKAETKNTAKTTFTIVNDEESDNPNSDKFEIKDNVISSKEALETGSYWVEVEGTYKHSDGKTYSDVTSVYFSVGKEVSFDVYFGIIKNEYTKRYTVASDYLGDFFTVAKTFGDALKEYNTTDASILTDHVKMYHYDTAGWYQFKNGKVETKVLDSAPLYTGYNEFYLRFAKDGKLYETPINKLPDSDIPLPPDGDDDDDNNGGNGGNGGGSHGGGSSRSSSSSHYSGSSNMSGVWKSDTNGWWFQKTDGSFAKSEWGMINGKWYWFNEAGYMATGWVYYSGRWYYMDDTSGAMITSSWILSNGKWYYLTGDGGMLSAQWFLYKNAWYYLDESGAMISNATTPDGYQVNADGIWIQ